MNEGMTSFGNPLYGNGSASYGVLNNTTDLQDVDLHDLQDLQDVVAGPDIFHNLALFKFIANVPVTMPIIIVGIIANVVEFIVLCHQKSKRSTTILLQCLAIIDTMVLVSSLLRCLEAVHSRSGSLSSYSDAFPYVYVCTYPFNYFIRLAGNWLTILLTIERYIVVCQPLDAQRICTKKRAYKNIAMVLVIAAVFSAPRLFELRLHGTGYRMTMLVRDTCYTVMYRIILYSICMYVVPVVLMTILNFWLLRELRKANQFASGSSVPAIKRSRLTVVVLLVVFVSIVCNSTAFVSHLLWSLNRCFIRLVDLTVKRRYLANISNVMVCLNSAVNFFIYCLCSRTFRQQLVRMFSIRGSCCRCCNNG